MVDATPAPTGPDDASWQQHAQLPTDPTDPTDPIEALRAELASFDNLPVADRVQRFEHANAVLASALAELDEV